MKMINELQNGFDISLLSEFECGTPAYAEMCSLVDRILLRESWDIAQRLEKVKKLILLLKKNQFEKEILDLNRAYKAFLDRRSEGGNTKSPLVITYDSTLDRLNVCGAEFIEPM